MKKHWKTYAIVIVMTALLISNRSVASGNSTGIENLDSISAGTTMLVSVASDGSPGDKKSESPVISDDGRFVAFQSSATNLVPGDINGEQDIFLHDNFTGKTTVVSIASNGSQANAWSENPAISGDGRYVVFSSNATNLVTGDSNGFPDIFLHDNQTGETKLVSWAENGSQSNGASYYPSISQDGRYVSFYSGADNIVSGDTNGFGDTFRHDLVTGENILVSVASDGTQGNANSWAGCLNYSCNTISSSGRYIVFRSEASNLVAEDTNARDDIFWHDATTGETIRVSVASDGTQGNDLSIEPNISGNGRYVVFASYARNLDDMGWPYSFAVYMHDTNSSTTTRVSVYSDGSKFDGDCHGPAISRDGQFISFQNGQVFVHDNFSGVTEIVSLASDGTIGDGSSQYSSISGDGQYVAIFSYASNLVSGDVNDDGDIFLVDRNGIGVAGNFMGLPVQLDNPDQINQSSQINSDYFTSTYNNPSLAAQGYPAGGMITAWFDHTNPNSTFNEDDNLTTYLGPYTGNRSISLYSNCVFGESCYDSHNGTDFDNSYDGELAVAVADGVVEYVCSNYASQGCPKGWGYGNYVLIDHHNGYATLYAHLASTSVSSGYINSGDPVGIIGNSGCGDCGTHLHFGVYYDPNYEGTGGYWPEGSEVDPFGWEGVGDDPWQNPSQNLWKFPTNEHEVISETGGTIHCPAGNCLSIIPPSVYVEPVTFDLWNSSPISGPLSLHRHAGGSIFLQILDWLFGGESVNNSTQSMFSSTLPEPIVVEMNYDPAKIPHLDTSQLAIHWWDESGELWIPLTTFINSEANTASAESYELGHFDLQAPLVCPVDDIESNDDPIFASKMPSDGTITVTLFDIEEDEDWFKFDAQEGNQYEITTENLFAGVDTILELYEPGGTTLLYSDDDSGEGMASALSWTAPEDGVYYLRVRQGDTSVFGCNATYDLVIFETPVSNDLDNPGFYVPSKYRWYLKTNRDDGWSGVTSFGWGGVSELLPVTGDWNGDGVDTPAFYKPSQWRWFLKNDHTDGWSGVTNFQWGGDAEMIPIAGDWDGDGDDTVGFYKPSTSEWYLKDDNTGGWTGFTTVVWGGAFENIPIAGDWDGDGYDTIGFFVPSANRWWLKNDLADGWAGVGGFTFGTADPMDPVVGDWDGDGTDTVGGYVAAKWRWFLKDDQVSGWSNVSNFKFGVTVDYEVIAGDWD